MRMSPKWVALAAVLPAALVFAGCDKTIDTGDLEKTIKESVQSGNGALKVSKVDCPDDITAKKGKKFNCTVTPSTGAPVAITVTLLDDEGKFTYAPATDAAGTTTGAEGAASTTETAPADATAP